MQMGKLNFIENWKKLYILLAPCLNDGWRIWRRWWVVCSIRIARLCNAIPSKPSFSTLHAACICFFNVIRTSSSFISNLSLTLWRCVALFLWRLMLFLVTLVLIAGTDAQDDAGPVQRELGQGIESCHRCKRQRWAQPLFRQYFLSPVQYTYATHRTLLQQPSYANDGVLSFGYWHFQVGTCTFICFSDVTSSSTMFYFIYFELAGKAVNVEDTDIPGLLHEMIVLLEEEETMEETTVRATCSCMWLCSCP